MHNPPHPGEFIYDLYMELFGYSCRFVAKQLDVSPSTLNRVLKGQSAVSPEMALRLSKSLGRTPESWLTMQDHYDLWQAKQNVNLAKVNTINFALAT
jgi:addiction module HigA family antidote